jgi:hypothetical protein
MPFYLCFFFRPPLFFLAPPFVGCSDCEGPLPFAAADCALPVAAADCTGALPFAAVDCAAPLPPVAGPAPSPSLGCVAGASVVVLAATTFACETTTTALSIQA